MSIIPTDEKVRLLKAVPVFKDMEEDEVRFLAGISKTDTWEDNGIVIEEGQLNETLFVIVNGYVAITRQKEGSEDVMHLATLGPGDYFGEMSLFEKREASATVSAYEGPADILLVESDPLMGIINQRPELAFSLFNYLCNKLRQANERIAQYEKALEEAGAQA